MSFDDETRRKAIWSTEAAAALGLSERRTRAQLWAEKRGLVEGSVIAADNIPARLGLACQDGILRLHAEDTGDALVALPNEFSLQLDVASVPVGSHYDAWNKTKKALHEVKFFGMQRRREFGDPGSDVVPYDVLVQALHEMMVWNHAKHTYGEAGFCEVDVVFGNVERAVFVVPYDAEAVDKLMQREAEFWALVQLETPPEPQSLEDAKRVWAKSNGSEVVADPQTIRAHQALMGLRQQVKALEAQADEMALYVQKAMGEAAVLKAPDGGVLATWKNVETERVDVKRLRAEMPQVAAKFVNKTASRRFLPKG